MLSLRKNCLAGTFSEASRFGLGRFRREEGAILGESLESSSLVSFLTCFQIFIANEDQDYHFGGKIEESS